MCPFSSVRRSEQDATFDKKKKIKGNSPKVDLRFAGKRSKDI